MDKDNSLKKLNGINKKKSFCNRVLTITQYGPTCWFNAILMSMLYSQRSRKKLLKASEKWNKRIKIYSIIKYILHNKYIKKDIIEDYKYFDNIKPENILTYLNKFDKNLFEFDPKKDSGYSPMLYVNKLYNFFNIKTLLLNTFYDNNKRNIGYSLYNHYEIIKQKKNNSNNEIKLKIHNLYKEFIHKKLTNINPDILIIQDKLKESLNKDYKTNYSHYDLKHYFNDNDINNLTSFNDTINFNNNIYELDSVILNNYNVDKDMSHSIAGITCKSKKYVYNGWTRYTLNDFNITDDMKNKFFDLPCELMPFEWDVKKSNEFCLNTKQCIPLLLKTKEDKANNKLCFSFDKGPRILIYVKKNKTDKLSVSPSKSSSKEIKGIKICPKNKILNPYTKRCINKDGLLCKKLNIIKKLGYDETDYKLNLQDSELLEDIKYEKCKLLNKVFNPLTKRCISKDGAVYKNLKKNDIIKS